MKKFAFYSQLFLTAFILIIGACSSPKQEPQKPNVVIIFLDDSGYGDFRPFSQDGIVMQGVKFKSKEVFEVGKNVTLTYTVNENNFRGNVNLQLMVDKVTV